jgi:phosphate transport system substrate-binding protein
MRKGTFTLIAATIALALVGAACSSGNSNNNGNSGGGGLSGKVTVSGSSTVLPISSLLAEEFSGDNPDVQISVNGPGTTDGFVTFCKGQTDINDASRAIEPEEVQACKQGGVNYIELQVAYDGITVMTNPANSSVGCLNKGDLYALIGPESKGFQNWSDADALGKEVDGRGVPYPDSPLDIVGPGEESGTYGAFIDLALKDIAGERGQPDDQTRPDYQSSGNDNIIIQGIEGSDSSLGWVGFAYAEENAGNVKILPIDGGDGNCVTPARDTIADHSYPLSRSLYIYVNTDKAGSNEALKAFVDFYLTDPGIKDGVSQAGYVDLPDDVIAETRSAWKEAAV